MKPKGLFVAWIAMVIVAGMCSVARAQAVDLSFTSVALDGVGKEGVSALKQIGSRAAVAGDPVPGGAGAGMIVGFTLQTRATNIGANPIPWFFPVSETSIGFNPWLRANVSPAFPSGFTGQEPNFNHAHDNPSLGNLPVCGAQPCTMAGDPLHPMQVGPHPHISFYIFRKPAPADGGATTIVGRSDLKHTYLFSAPNAVPRQPPVHEVPPPVAPATRGTSDTYSVDHNQDQSFFGPIAEMDPASFRVAAHDHMASPYFDDNGDGVINSMDKMHRDHGELNFAGGNFPDGTAMPANGGHPGATNIDHLLQVSIADLEPGTVANPAGTRWFLGGAYWVVNDNNLANNFQWVEITPAFAGGVFTFTYGAVGVGSNTVPMFDPTTDPYLLRLVPEPATMGLLLLGLAALLPRRRRG